MLYPVVNCNLTCQYGTVRNCFWHVRFELFDIPTLLNRIWNWGRVRNAFKNVPRKLKKGCRKVYGRYRNIRFGKGGFSLTDYWNLLKYTIYIRILVQSQWKYCIDVFKCCFWRDFNKYHRNIYRSYNTLVHMIHSMVGEFGSNIWAKVYNIVTF